MFSAYRGHTAGCFSVCRRQTASVLRNYRHVCLPARFPCKEAQELDSEARGEGLCCEPQCLSLPGCKPHQEKTNKQTNNSQLGPLGWRQEDHPQLGSEFEAGLGTDRKVLATQSIMDLIQPPSTLMFKVRCGDKDLQSQHWGGGAASPVSSAGCQATGPTQCGALAQVWRWEERLDSSCP